MLDLILKMLNEAKGETENIRIAQGKNKLTTTVKDSYKQLKKEVKWLQKK